jgi:hypothetical protein
VVRDVPMPAKYDNETSSLRIGRVALSFPFKYARAAAKRFFYSYVLRDFNAASMQFLLAVVIGCAGIAFGIDKWVESNETGVPADIQVRVMFAALPILVAFQLLLAALHYDIQNVAPRAAAAEHLGDHGGGVIAATTKSWNVHTGMTRVSRKVVDRGACPYWDCSSGTRHAFNP